MDSNTDDEYLEEATDVFVLLLTCLNSRFKVIQDLLH